MSKIDLGAPIKRINIAIHDSEKAVLKSSWIPLFFDEITIEGSGELHIIPDERNIPISLYSIKEKMTMAVLNEITEKARFEAHKLIRGGLLATQENYNDSFGTSFKLGYIKRIQENFGTGFHPEAIAYYNQLRAEPEKYLRMFTKYEISTIIKEEYNIPNWLLTIKLYDDEPDPLEEDGPDEGARDASIPAAAGWPGAAESVPAALHRPVTPERPVTPDPSSDYDEDNLEMSLLGDE